MIEVEARTLEEAPDLSGGWNKDSVRRPLWEGHLRKCYLCESKVSLGSFEIDHRVPQQLSDSLGRCWFNLFPACKRCNNRRGSAYPAVGGLLSPGLDQQLEARLQQAAMWESGTELCAHFRGVDPDDVYAANTGRELTRLHAVDQATTDTARMATRELLDAIADRYMDAIHPLALRALRARRRGQPDLPTEDKLRAELGRDKPYTMLVRSLLPADLSDLAQD